MAGLTELQQAADALRESLRGVDENLKRLTGRDPEELTRPAANNQNNNNNNNNNRRVSLKRNAYVGGVQQQAIPAKRQSGEMERRRWGRLAVASVQAGNANGGAADGAEEPEEEQPSVASSVVATGTPISIEDEQPRVEEVDRQVRSRNRRMFGLLVGTLKQFKKESSVKSETDRKREEAFNKVEEHMVAERREAIAERRQLFQTRREKQNELKQLEYKMELAELKEELKNHYDLFENFIQLRSTPRLFYAPAQHNKATRKLLEQSRKNVDETYKKNCASIDESGNEPIDGPRRPAATFGRGRARPCDNPQPNAGQQGRQDGRPSARDLFAEDAAADEEYREAGRKALLKADAEKIPQDEATEKQVGEEKVMSEAHRHPVSATTDAAAATDTEMRPALPALPPAAVATELITIETVEDLHDDLDLKEHDTSAFDFKDDYNIVDERHVTDPEEVEPVMVVDDSDACSALPPSTEQEIDEVVAKVEAAAEDEDPGLDNSAIGAIGGMDVDG